MNIEFHRRVPFLLALYHEYHTEHYDLNLVKLEARNWDRDFTEFLDRDGRSSLKAFPHLRGRCTKNAMEMDKFLSEVAKHYGYKYEHVRQVLREQIHRMYFREVECQYSYYESEINSVIQKYKDHLNLIRMNPEPWERELFDRSILTRDDVIKGLQ